MVLHIFEEKVNATLPPPLYRSSRASQAYYQAQMYFYCIVLCVKGDIISLSLNQNISFSHIIVEQSLVLLLISHPVSSASEM